MKKLLAVVLALVLCISVIACAPGEQVPQTASFIATVLEINGDVVLVEPVEGQPELASADKISFGISQLNKLEVVPGDTVQITYTGGIMETYPAKINATQWEISKNLRHLEYTEVWLDKGTAEKREDDLFDHIVITEIYSNCFFAQTVIPMPWKIKLNGKLSEDWCVGDQVQCTYENTYWDSTLNRLEADLLTVEASDWQPDPNAAYKPVIYLYSQEEMQVSVKLTGDGALTCTYPDYGTGWQVTAQPDGTLTDSRGQTYNYLYWEGITDTQWDMSQGFCVKGEYTAAFLENALEQLGLTRREANEFIVYWLPQMQESPYNVISFQTEAYTNAFGLHVDPAPDTVIRVFMTWQPVNSYRELPAQELTAPEREGFTVVEWGGTKLPVNAYGFSAVE